MIRYCYILIIFLLLSCSTEGLKKDLQGTWINTAGNDKLIINDIFQFHIYNSENGKQYLGKSDIKFGEIELKGDSSFCKSIEGTYYYELYKDTLQLRTKSDKCLLRTEYLDKQKFIKEKL